MAEPIRSSEPVVATSGGLAAVGADLPARNFVDQVRRGAIDPSLHSGLTILAIGVFVRGTEPLLAGSRYVIARTDTQLIVAGPLEPSPDPVKLELPLDEVEATFVPDRLVVSGWTAARSRRWVLAFLSLTGLTASAIDEALMATHPVDPQAVGQT